MQKIVLHEYNDWIPYEGFAEGSGRSEKIWLQSDTGKIGLFKYPKVDSQTKTITYEHVSEHLASKIGAVLNINTAYIELGTYKGRAGCMSYLINAPNEHIIEGGVILSGVYPDYDLDSLMETETGRYYCVDYFKEISLLKNCMSVWIEMMLFDFIIGNSDRHQNNWGLLISFERGHEFVAPCPLYDNGSSLCCYVKEDMIMNYLGKDLNRFESLVESKSKSIIRIDGFNKQKPRHSEVVRWLLKEFPETRDIAIRFMRILNNAVLDDVMGAYESVISEKRIELIKRFLNRKVEILYKLSMEI